MASTAIADVQNGNVDSTSTGVCTLPYQWQEWNTWLKIGLLAAGDTV